MEQKISLKKGAGLAAMFSVASVLFGWHAGGGFATGNQAHQFYVISGRLGPLSGILAMLLLTLTIRQAIIMYNQRKLSSYKELFETLYHPLDRLEIVFEVYYYIMVIMATSSSIAGAGTLLEDAFGMSYILSVVLVGVILLLLTMVGAGLVRSASSVMSVLILLCAVIIFITGIARKSGEIARVLAAPGAAESVPFAVLKSFQYAGFQCASIPAMIGCCSVLKGDSDARGSMWISFAMNAVALTLSVFMLLGWQSVYTAVENGTTIPTLTVCKQIGVAPLVWAYYICLFLCFLSTGVSAIFGIANRFEHAGFLARGIQSSSVRRVIVSVVVMLISMGISFLGLTNIVRYGYGYCGYVGIAIIILPFLTVGVYKNRRYAAEHPEAS